MRLLILLIYHGCSPKHNLPDSPFASPTKPSFVLDFFSSGEDMTTFSLTNNDSNNRHQTGSTLLPTTSSLDVPSSFSSRFLQMPRYLACSWLSSLSLLLVVAKKKILLLFMYVKAHCRATMVVIRLSSGHGANWNVKFKQYSEQCKLCCPLANKEYSTDALWMASSLCNSGSLAMDFAGTTPSQAEA